MSRSKLNGKEMPRTHRPGSGCMRGLCALCLSLVPLLKIIPKAGACSLSAEMSVVIRLGRSPRLWPICRRHHHCSLPGSMVAAAWREEDAHLRPRRSPQTLGQAPPPSLPRAGGLSRALSTARPASGPGVRGAGAAALPAPDPSRRGAVLDLGVGATECGWTAACPGFQRGDPR